MLIEIAALDVIFFGRALGPWQWIGIVAVFVAITLLQIQKRQINGAHRPRPVGAVCFEFADLFPVRAQNDGASGGHIEMRTMQKHPQIPVGRHVTETDAIGHFPAAIVP